MEDFIAQSFTKLYETAFSTVYIHKTHPVICHEYKPTTEYMNKEQYEMELNLLIEHINDYRAEGLFSDTRAFLFAITPDLQEWTNQHLFGNIPTIKKIAVMISPDFITQVSIEQTVEENKTDTIQTRFFADSHKALAWLGIS